ncbi:MAG: hypothetical protein CMF71_02285 [Magnetovibrio sp.]|nr:hypothetical protein [Magnetovibrio sp.]|tara:strand:+ start:199 stop:390 length:192 start_codon:yes stop_codon:yes gene_type:complete
MLIIDDNVLYIFKSLTRINLVIYSVQPRNLASPLTVELMFCIDQEGSGCKLLISSQVDKKYLF